MNGIEKFFNTLGLVSGMVGVAIMFHFGPPQPKLDTGVSIIVEDATPIDKSGKTAAQHDAEIIELRKTYDTMSKIGLALVGVGFAFQLAALWLPRNSSPERKVRDGATRKSPPSEGPSIQAPPKKKDKSAP